MRKEYISPEIEIQKFTIYCDELISTTPNTEEEDGENDFPAF